MFNNEYRIYSNTTPICCFEKYGCVLFLAMIFLLQPEQEFRMALKRGGFAGPVLVSYLFA
jgi:hypothetical protein